MIRERTDAEKLARLRALADHSNHNGKDSTKRAFALYTLCGPADSFQTDRLVALAIAMLVARGVK